MRRVNSFTVVPRSDADEELLCRLLDASASLWNQLTYERRQNFTDPDIDKSVWETEDYRKQYVGVLGSGTAQQVIRKNTEAWTSQTCPQCGSTEATTRHKDTLTCSCGFEGHADLTASETFLRWHEADVPRPMARPVCLKWDDHRWSASPRVHRPNEEHTHPQVTAGESASPNPHGGILAR